MADLTGTSALSLPSLSLASGGVRYKNYPTSLSANTTLVSDTYLMSANCDCNSYKLTFDCDAGSIVVKRSGDYYHTEQGAIDTTNSSATNKVYLTVLNDDTIGTILPGSTGSPAVSGGSWGNGVQKTNVAITMNWWEVRWMNNVIFLNYACGTSLLSFQNIVFSNCAHSSTYVLSLSSSHTSAIIKYINYDSTSYLTSTATFCSLYTSGIGSYVGCIKVVNANTTGTTNVSAVFQGGYNTSSSYQIDFLNIAQAGSAYCVYRNIQGGIFTLNHCKLDSAGYQLHFDEGGGTIGTIILKNNLILNGKGIYGVVASSSGAMKLRWYNNIFKGMSTNNLSDNTRVVWYMEACRNNIFDSNARIVSKAISGYFGIKNNGYYGNTETNWTRGTGDETISNPSFTTFPNGTVHPDFITYGPGNSWYTTQDISTGADTNSLCGIDVATQSHTGITETLVTQRLGLAPVFSVLE